MKLVEECSITAMLKPPVPIGPGPIGTGGFSMAVNEHSWTSFMRVPPDWRTAPRIDQLGTSTVRHAAS